MKKVRIVEKIKDGTKIKGYKLDNGRLVSKEDVSKLINEGKITNARIQVYQGREIIRVKSGEGEDKGNKRKYKYYVYDIKQEEFGQVCKIYGMDGKESIGTAIANGEIKNPKVKELADKGLIEGLKKSGKPRIVISDNKMYRAIAGDRKAGLVLISEGGKIVKVRPEERNEDRIIIDTLKKRGKLGKIDEDFGLDRKLYSIMCIFSDEGHRVLQAIQSHICVDSIEGDRLIIDYTECTRELKDRNRTLGDFRDYSLVISIDKLFRYGDKEDVMRSNNGVDMARRIAKKITRGEKERKYYRSID